MRKIKIFDTIGTIMSTLTIVLGVCVAGCIETGTGTVMPKSAEWLLIAWAAVSIISFVCFEYTELLNVRYRNDSEYRVRRELIKRKIEKEIEEMPNELPMSYFGIYK